MQQSPDTTQWPVSSLARALDCGGFTSSEVAAAHIAKINALNPSVNAIIQLPLDRVLEEGSIVDRAPQGRQSALRGLPFTVKDNFETQGVITAIGMLERKATMPSNDAALVTRAQPGGHLVGKDQLSSGWWWPIHGQRGLRSDEQPIRPLAHSGRK